MKGEGAAGVLYARFSFGKVRLIIRERIRRGSGVSFRRGKLTTVRGSAEWQLSKV